MKQVLKEMNQIKAEIVDLMIQMNKLLDRVDRKETVHVSKKSKSNPVFYRYIRPFNDGVDSQRGVTLRIELNYKTRKVQFSYAICNNKNGEPSFEKEVGRRIANSRKRYEIDLWKEPGPLLNSDITEFVVKSIEFGNVDIPSNDQKMILNMYQNS